MQTVIVVIHLMVVVALVGVVLLQRSEGGALGIGGGGGFMSVRGAANALTRTTAILAAAFFATSISLGVLARIESKPTDILKQIPVQSQNQGKTEGGGVFNQLAAPKQDQSEPQKQPEGPQIPSGQ